MSNYLNRLRNNAILVFTSYNDVKEALESNDLNKVKFIVKQGDGERAMCLVIFVGLLALEVRQGTSGTLIACDLGAILFTGRLSLAFKAVTVNQFNKQVEAIGGAAFYTVVSMVPAIIAQEMLLYEIFTTCSSVGLAVVITILCYIPSFISFVGMIVKA
ncbi:hypothetical protein BDQ17DRAFT_1329019 [Cyathus striatus]|nr:hypothetical protein BDQ17DRAFT_1335049 [Cyathus striatus]KAF8997970.1 hypothetical protein BDQ17DRAFT_1329019 [Cyathus striatus]